MSWTAPIRYPAARPKTPPTGPEITQPTAAQIMLGNIDPTVICPSPVTKLFSICFGQICIIVWPEIILVIMMPDRPALVTVSVFQEYKRIEPQKRFGYLQIND